MITTYPLIYYPPGWTRQILRTLDPDTQRRAHLALVVKGDKPNKWAM